MNITVTTVQQKSVLISEEQALTILKAFVPTNQLGMLKRINDMTRSAIEYAEHRKPIGTEIRNRPGYKSNDYPELEPEAVILQIKTELDLAAIALHLRDTLNAPAECNQALKEIKKEDN